MSLPKKHWSLAVLIALALGLVGLTVPAQAAISRTATLTLTPVQTTVNTPITYSGRVTNSPVGSTVRILRKSGTTWVLARTTQTTNAAGNYSVRLNAPATPGTYSFRAYAPPSGTRLAATSTTRNAIVRLKATATLTAAPESITSGSASTLSGTVSPATTGLAVQVQRLSSGSWVSVANLATTAGGAFTTQVAPTVTTTYRAVTAQTATLATTTSPSRVVTVTSGPEAPAITTTAIPAGSKNVAYSTTLAATGGPGTWTKAAGNLPAGVTLAPATGVLSGTPTSAGVFNFTVAFTNGAGVTDTQNLQLVIAAAPVITTTALPDAVRAQAYTTTLTASTPGTWAIESLPAGLSLNPTTGVISGIPKYTGEFGVYPVFTEAGTGVKAYKILGLKVTGQNLAVTTESIPTATKGLPYSVTFAANNGPGTWSYSTLEEGNPLPAGLSFDAATGTLSGTPTESGLFAFYAIFTETSTGVVAFRGYSLEIEVTPKITTNTLPDGTTGSAYSQQLEKTGSAGTWAYDRGNLPPGVTVSAAGVVSGTPTEAGDFSFVVTFTETSTGFSDEQRLILHVSDPGAPVITTSTLPVGTEGTPYTGAFEGEGDGTWAITFGQLPPGLLLDPATGAISGTPMDDISIGDWAFQVTYTSGGKTNTKVLAIRILPASAPTA